jgi:uncharacterized YccA/Bax inhibitor family protein
MRLKLQTNSLRQTSPMEYTRRFVFGGMVTVIATLIANKWGPVIGGMFLAFPGIFPAGVSLVEEHKTERESKAGKRGVAVARAQASVQAAGASAGTWGLAGFGLVVWKESAIHPLPIMLVCAGLAWAVLSWTVWMLRDKHAVLRK